MTVKKAIEELQRLKDEEARKLQPDVYIINRLACMIDDLTLFIAAPYGSDIDLCQEIAEKIKGKTQSISELAPISIDHAWVNTLYLAFLTMFRHEQCKVHYKDNSSQINCIIDGETYSKWVAIISAGFSILASIVALILFKFFKIGADRSGEFNYDKVVFIIDLVVQVIAIVCAAGAYVWNKCWKTKFYATSQFSREELLAIKHENEGKKDKPGFPSPFSVKRILSTGSANAENNSVATSSFCHVGDIYISHPEPQYAKCPRCGKKVTRCPDCGQDLTDHR